MNLVKKIFTGSDEISTTTLEKHDGINYNNNHFHNHCKLDNKAVSNLLIQMKNCRIVRNSLLIKEDLWIRDGRILDPEKIFFDERKQADLQIDCDNLILAPGFIDVQINGAFGKDFTFDCDNISDNLCLVSNKLLKYGVTAFCPTIVSSEPSVYSKIIPKIKKTFDKSSTYANGRQTDGASILGIHLEGPFINKEKQGAHETKVLCTFENNGLKTLEQVYGPLDVLVENTAILTLAPELDHDYEVIKYLTSKHVIVSLGHSMANLSQGEEAIKHGAKFITHLFNAMMPFHHRDPHLIGLLSNRNFITQGQIYYGIIADGIHTHPSAINIAYKSHPNGLVLVTDAMSAMGLEDGMVHQLGNQNVQIVRDDTHSHVRSAYLEGTKTLCGSVATMDDCVRNLMYATGCSLVDALKCASEHPAKLLNIFDHKGSLNFGADADFIVIDDDVNVKATFLKGDVVWSLPEWSPLLQYKFIPSF